MTYHDLPDFYYPGYPESLRDILDNRERSCNVFGINAMPYVVLAGQLVWTMLVMKVIPFICRGLWSICFPPKDTDKETKWNLPWYLWENIYVLFQIVSTVWQWVEFILTMPDIKGWLWFQVFMWLMVNSTGLPGLFIVFFDSIRGKLIEYEERRRNRIVEDLSYMENQVDDEDSLESCCNTIIKTRCTACFICISLFFMFPFFVLPWGLVFIPLAILCVCLLWCGSMCMLWGEIQEDDDTYGKTCQSFIISTGTIIITFVFIAFVQQSVTYMGLMYEGENWVEIFTIEYNSRNFAEWTDCLMTHMSENINTKLNMIALF